MTRKIKCPVCRKITTWDNNQWRPFCSERCKTIDLGDWASEKHVIAGSENLQELDEENPIASSYPYGKEN
jgi:uncharacterized protein